MTFVNQLELKGRKIKNTYLWFKNIDHNWIEKSHQQYQTFQIYKIQHRVKLSFDKNKKDAETCLTQSNTEIGKNHDKIFKYFRQKKI